MIRSRRLTGRVSTGDGRGNGRGFGARSDASTVCRSSMDRKKGCDARMQTPAIVLIQGGTVALRTIEMPNPGPGEVQVRTTCSMISGGTEGWIARDQFTWSPVPFPCVPGYQRVGVIAALGPGVEGWRVGDRVAATIGAWHGPVQPFWGAHAALANTPAAELYPIPNGVDDLSASGVVVVQVGYNAASRARVAEGDWVLVYGDGLVGQCAAQSMRARGARVILVGHREDRLALAAACSADAVIAGQHDDVIAAVRQHIGDAAVCAVLDTVQTSAAQRQYLPLLAPARGQIVYCGFAPGTCWAEMHLLQQAELTVHFVAGWTRARIDETLALMAAGKLRLRSLITHVVPYAQGPEMYRINEQKAIPFLGIALNWTEDAR